MNELSEKPSIACDSVDLAAPAPHVDAEAELVERAKADPAAFGELYEANYPLILNYLYRRTLNVRVAEELTSNTFFKALRGLLTFEPRQGIRFRSWLYRIATNEAGMHWRSLSARGVSQELPGDDDLSRITFVWPETESPEDARAKQTRFAVVHQALGRVPGAYRTALTLRYFEGLPLEEIGAVLDKPVGTIKSLVHRGLEKFAKAMAELGESE